jgi:hypothetical protein
VSLDIALQTGGVAVGSAAPSSDLVGCTMRWKNTTDSSSQWRGYTDVPFVTYCRTSAMADATDDYPQVCPVRRLPNGSIGYVALKHNSGGTQTPVFRYKASRTTATWTEVNIRAASSDVAVNRRPAWVILKSGRLIAYVDYLSKVYAYTSTDNGATWSLWSKDTRATRGPALSAEVAGDAVCLVSGASDATSATLYVMWSFDGGQTFSGTGSDSALRGHALATTPAGDGVVLFASTSADGSIYAYTLPAGGALGDYTDTALNAVAASPAFGAVTHDDGSIYVFCGVTHSPCRTIDARASHDGGMSFVAVGGTSTAYQTVWIDGNTSNIGYKSLSLGRFESSLVLLGVTDVTTVADDDSTQELWFGGYDSLTRNNNGSYAFMESSLTGYDLPDNLGYTKTDVGAGATVSTTINGTRIIGTGAVNSYYTSNTAAFSPATGESRHLLFIGKVSSDGSVADRRSILVISIDDGTNRQFVEFRFSTTQIRALDNSGTLATVSLDTTSNFELLVAFHHDYPSAGGGLASASARAAGDTFWTPIISNQAIAELAGSTGDFVRFGGTDAGAVDWTIQLVAIYEDDNGLSAGFTNPTDLTGRAISLSKPVFVKSDVYVGAYGGVGAAGDTYTLTTTYQHRAALVWANARPSSRWKADDNSNQNAVFYGNSRLFYFDAFALVGTNYPNARVEWNSSDSWATPAGSASMSAVVWSGVASAGGKGFIEVDGFPFAPGGYRSVMGRKWYLLVAGAQAYEITDNSAGRIFVAADLSAHTGAAVKVYGDRMAAFIPVATGAEYLRLVIEGASIQADSQENAWETGTFYVGTRHTMTVPYASQFVTELVPMLSKSASDAGYTSIRQRGPTKWSRRIAWDPMDRNFDGYPAQLSAFMQALDVGREPVCFWPDTGVPQALRLVTIDGAFGLENVTGEGFDDFSRVAQLTLTEFV